METRLKEGFAKADADEDGFLTREEFAAIPTRGRGQGRGGQGGQRQRNQQN